MAIRSLRVWPRRWGSRIWPADPRFATHAARGAHQTLLDEIIAAWTATLTMAEVDALMVAHGVPAGRLYQPPDMFADPHFAAREALIEVPHPHYGSVRMQGVFPKLSKTPGGVSPAGGSAGGGRQCRGLGRGRPRPGGHRRSGPARHHLAAPGLVLGRSRAHGIRHDGFRSGRPAGARPARSRRHRRRRFRPPPSMTRWKSPARIWRRADCAAGCSIDVKVNGKGPYRFVVDTGADRTVIGSRPRRPAEAAGRGAGASCAASSARARCRRC